MSVPYAPISNIVPWTQAIAGLNQAIYSTTWTANEASDILVYSRVPGEPTSDILQLVPTNQYTVQFIGADNIVQVTFGNAYIPLQYNIITIMRATPSEFLNLYTNTNFTPSMLNSDFENLTLVDQQNQLYWQQIVPRYNNSASVNVPIDTILPVLGANQFWIKNSTNTAFIPMTFSGGGGGGVPTNAPLITYVADSGLSNAFNLGSLANGILAQNVLFGLATPYTIPIPLPVSDGGTGLDSVNPYSVIIGGTSGTSAFQTLSNVGAAGQVLTSAGAGMPPSFQTVPNTLGGIINVQYFTSSGTYTPTAGATQAIVEVVGGGGGSGGCASTSTGQVACSAGGGGGGYARSYISSLSSQTVTVGAGGNGATAGANTGSTGGTTSFGPLVSASGGAGGQGGTANTGSGGSNGGIGGSGLLGDITIQGTDGGNGQSITGPTVTFTNSGGGTQYAGTVGANGGSATPSAGKLYGGGAAGSYVGASHAAVAGAAGASGICIITEYT